MSATNRNRVSKGVSTGGQFAREARGDSGVSLSRSQPASVDAPPSFGQRTASGSGQAPSSRDQAIATAEAGLNTSLMNWEAARLNQDKNRGFIARITGGYKRAEARFNAACEEYSNQSRNVHQVRFGQ